jgi:lipopolysaccharide transport system ATP-binding protein
VICQTEVPAISDITIQIEKVGKRYRYGGAAPLSYNLRADITQWVKGLFRHGQHRHATLHEVQEKHLDESPDYFWALKDINLEIKQGEVVGIIGRNGAGKSTLLKILSRITPPTTGTITYHGRVASLLEVGTGFHRELTGRENVFLNGSILGMKRSEIAKKFDEIVAFAEVEKFIDMPVKFYSSGMYVRLAFAVAAHLEPEILIVDEVLAVGDAEFQKKCLGKMGDVAKQGRTILFVSHNMAAIQSLCKSALLLFDGKVVEQGEVPHVVSSYLDRTASVTAEAVATRTDREGTGDLRFTKLRIIGPDGKTTSTIPCGGPVSFDLAYETRRPITSPIIFLGIYDLSGTQLINFNSMMTRLESARTEATGQFVCHVPELPLPAGEYRVNIAASERFGAQLDRVVSAATLTITSADFFGSGYDSPSGGIFLVRHDWRHTSTP